MGAGRTDVRRRGDRAALESIYHQRTPGTWMMRLLIVLSGLWTSALGTAQTVEVLPTTRPEVCCPQNTTEPCRTCPIEGVDCLDNTGRTEPCWKFHRPLPWQVFAQGEYVGPYRPAHVPEYRLRVDDELDFAYRITRDVDPVAYELNVGDKIRVESVGDSQLDRELIIQPDGNITLRLLGQVRAAGRSVQQLRDDLQPLDQLTAGMAVYPCGASDLVLTVCVIESPKDVLICPHAALSPI